MLSGGNSVNSSELDLKEHKRNLIIKTAEQIFFEKSYYETTMAEIAKKAGIAKGTLYLYFPSKKELYYTIVVKGLIIIDKIINKNIKKCVKGFDKVVAMGLSYIEFYRQHPQYYIFIANYETHEVKTPDAEPLIIEAYHKSEKLFKYLVQFIKEGIADNSIDPHIKPMEMALVLWSQTTGLIQQVHLRKKLFALWSGLQNPDNILDFYIEVTKKVLKPESKAG